jgi:hypothetical protein
VGRKDRPNRNADQSRTQNSLVESQEISMKALVSALALLSFVGAATVPAVAFAQDAAAKPAKAKKHTAHKTAKKSSKKKAASQS